MKVLIACEESQRICIEMRKLGHEAYSCDILPASGGHPEWHIQGDCTPLINGKCKFVTQDNTEHNIVSTWDLLIAHPDCTYLAVTGNKWFNVEKYGDSAIQRVFHRDNAINFFMMFANADCEHICIENPVGIMSTKWRKPDQIIQPYMFGEHARKKTCLWLKNLPLLKPTEIVDPGYISKQGLSLGASAYYACDEQGKILKFCDPETKRIRARTYVGIAKAMAKQYTEYIENTLI